MKNPALPPGLSDPKTVEIFVKDNIVHALHNGMVTPFTGLHPNIQESFREEFKLSNLCKTIIEVFPTVTNEEEAFLRWLACNFGGFDNTPDYANDHKSCEQWDCGHRGKCKAEGIICKTDHLSAREIEVMRCIGLGKPDKLIAEELEISINTVLTHEKRIRRKINAYNRIEVMRFAIKNNFINQ